MDCHPGIRERAARSCCAVRATSVSNSRCRPRRWSMGQPAADWLRRTVPLEW